MIIVTWLSLLWLWWWFNLCFILNLVLIFVHLLLVFVFNFGFFFLLVLLLLLLLFVMLACCIEWEVRVWIRWVAGWIDRLTAHLILTCETLISLCFVYYWCIEALSVTDHVQNQKVQVSRSAFESGMRAFSRWIRTSQWHQTLYSRRQFV